MWRGINAALAGLAACTIAGGAAAQQSWQNTVRAAEAEGRVTVIGPPIEAHRETIQQFQKAYPKIRLELSGLTSAEYEPKCLSG